MSTRSRIAIQLDTGRYLSVYCHHDGYPKYLGHQLETLTYKNSEKLGKALDLIGGGDISYIENGKAAYYAKRGEWDLHGAGNEPWEDVKPHTSNNFQELTDVTNDCNGAYLYVLYRGAKGWTCYDSDWKERDIWSEYIFQEAA